MKKKLTDTDIKQGKDFKPRDDQFDVFDAKMPRFGVRVSPHGVKSFVYMYRFGGQLRRATLGRYPQLSLADARKKVTEIDDAVSEGRDPRIEKQQHGIETKRQQGDTYAAAVEDFIEGYAKAKKRNRTWAAQRRLLLRAETAPWHKRPVASITSRDVNDLLNGLMKQGKPYAANRTYEVLRTFFKWLWRQDRVPLDIMAKVETPFDDEKARTRVWTDDELRRIWQSAAQLSPVECGYIRLLLLVGQRRDEVVDIRWNELKLDGDPTDNRFKGPIWLLPGERAKSKRDHIVPLSTAAVEVLKALPRVKDSPFVFPGRDPAKAPMMRWTDLRERVQKVSGVSDFTFHDARRTLRTGLDELGIQPHVKDECLNHARQGVGDRHYSMYAYLPEQASAFQAWANKIAKLTGAPETNVVTMAKQKRNQPASAQMAD
jgi:integrase